MNNEKARGSLFGVAAVYLCYGLFRDRHDTATTMAPTVRWLFLVLFAAAALALGIYALRLWKQGQNEELQQQNARGELSEEKSEALSGEEPEQSERE